MRLIHLDDLTDDMVLGRSILNEDGKILLGADCKNLSKYKEKLFGLGIQHIYINDELSSDIIIEDVISEETRLQTQNIIKKTMNNVQFNKELDYDSIKSVIVSIIEEILQNKNINSKLTDIRTMDGYTFNHSVNVSVLSLIMGKAMNYNYSQLLDLGIGALLHDIGKILIPPVILNKPSQLTYLERKLMEEHSKLGYECVKSNNQISSLAKYIIFSHHERLDGSGYPQKITGESIHAFSKIVAIADVFDAMTSDRVYRKKWPVSETLEFLMSNTNHFDKNIINIFIKNIAAYPNGTMVKLSNGFTAIVKEQNHRVPLRPIIKVIIDNNDNVLEEPIYINLRDELSITIIDSN